MHWIINLKTHEYIKSETEIFDGDWKNNYPHTKSFEYVDVLAFKPWEFERTSNGIYYGYDLTVNGGLFCFYVDMTKHTKDDIEHAKRELRNNQDVVSLTVLELKPYAGI